MGRGGVSLVVNIRIISLYFPLHVMSPLVYRTSTAASFEIQDGDVIERHVIMSIVALFIYLSCLNNYVLHVEVDTKSLLLKLHTVRA